MFLSEQNTAKALVGGAVWLLVLPFSLSNSPEGELIQRILLLGVLVIVPLGLALIDTISDRSSAFLNIAAASQPFAALAIAISSFLEPGFGAAGLALPWLITTSLIGLDGFIGLGRLRKSASPAVATLPVLAAMIYLPVGAVWLIMSRLGIQPLGFGDTIVLLTAVHFHFAGFAAPLLTGLTGHHLPGIKQDKTDLPAGCCRRNCRNAACGGWHHVLAVVGFGWRHSDLGWVSLPYANKYHSYPTVHLYATSKNTHGDFFSFRYPRNGPRRRLRL
jgi:hypothetical protein